jgi:hypothetical protein
MSSVDKCELLVAPNFGFARNEEPYIMGSDPKDVLCKKQPRLFMTWFGEMLNNK